MKNIINRIKLAFVAVLVALMSVPFSAFFNQAHAAAPDLTPAEKTLSDGVVLSKKAEAVAGWNNKWKITLQVKAPKIDKTSDTILVIDRSRSMNGNRMTSAKNAALDLAARLLPAGNTTNRVAVISFADDVTPNNPTFSDSYASVVSAINGLNASGGTFTQGGMRAAANLMATSTAQIKNIILLSDGEPTYSYGFTDAAIDTDNYFEYFRQHWLFGSDEYESKSTVPRSAFNNSRVGDGTEGNIPCARENWLGYCSSHKYYNHGNSAIAEAGYYKSQNIGDLYTIALQAGTDGKAVLDKMSSFGKAEDATPENLQAIFEKIGGNIMNLIQSATVEDSMGTGIVVTEMLGEGTVSGNGGGQLDWNLTADKFTFTKDLFGAGKDGFLAETSYIVEATENDIWNSGADSFKLNDPATITYNGGQPIEFPTPTIPKPMAIKVKKEMGQSDQTPTGTKFDMEVTGPAGFAKETFSLGKNDTKTIVKAFPVGSYGITETGINSSTPISGVTLDNYDVSYSNKTFNIAQGQTDNVNITVMNTYEETTVTAEKKWVDGSDQDGLRDKLNAYFVVKNGNTIVDFGKIDTTEDNPKPFESKKLPKNYNGTAISYTVDEMVNCKDTSGVLTCDPLPSSTISGYTTSSNSNVFTNSHTPATISIAVNKDWNDDTDRDGLRNASNIYFCVTGIETTTNYNKETCSNQLSADITHSLLIDDKIEVEFRKLPKYSKGKEISYQVTEKGMLGTYSNNIPAGYLTITNNSGNLDVTNTHDPYKRDIKAQIAWDDDGDTANRPASVYVTLKNGAGTIMSKTIKVGETGPDPSFIDPGVIESCGPWCVTFKDKYVNENGSEIQYQVVQSATTDPNDTTIPNHDTFTTGDMANGFTITNARQYNMEAVINWDDYNNQYNSRPASVIVVLEADRQVVSSATIEESGGQATRGTVGNCGKWCASFNNFPRAKLNNGVLEPINYTVRQTTLIPNYATSIAGNVATGFTVNNTYHKPVVPSPSPSPSNGFGALSPDTGFNTKTTEGSKASSNLMVLSAIPAMLAVVGLSALIATTRRKK